MSMQRRIRSLPIADGDGTELPRHVDEGGSATTVCSIPMSPQQGLAPGREYPKGPGPTRTMTAEIGEEWPEK